MRVIGPFTIGGRIARGAHARVHEAHRSDAPHRRCAAKVAHPGEEHRLHREATVLRAVSHPALIACVALVDDGRSAALVLPRAHGSLSTLIGTLDAPEVASVVAEILEALAALHRHGWAHGDVRAANVLLFDEGRAVLADLGVAVAATATERDADVLAAARLGRSLLGATGGGRLDALLDRAEAGDDAASLAARLRAAVPAARRPSTEHLRAVADEPPTLQIAHA